MDDKQRAGADGGVAESQAEADHRPSGDAELLKFTEFYKAQYRNVVYLVMLLGGNVAEAEDAAQKAFMEVFEKWATVRKEIPYVKTVAKHYFWKARMRDRPVYRSHSAEDVPEPQDPQAEEQLHEGAAREWVEWVLSELPRRQRAVVDGILEGLSNEEIAQLMSTKLENVRSNLRHARATLKKRLDSIEMIRTGSEKGEMS